MRLIFNISTLCDLMIQITLPIYEIRAKEQQPLIDQTEAWHSGRVANMSPFHLFLSLSLGWNIGVVAAESWSQACSHRLYCNDMLSFSTCCLSAARSTRALVKSHFLWTSHLPAAYYYSRHHPSPVHNDESGMALARRIFQSISKTSQSNKTKWKFGTRHLLRFVLISIRCHPYSVRCVIVCMFKLSDHWYWTLTSISTLNLPKLTCLKLGSAATTSQRPSRKGRRRCVQEEVWGPGERGPQNVYRSPTHPQ